MISRQSFTRVCTIGLRLYELEEQVKPIYSEKGQKRGCHWEEHWLRRDTERLLGDNDVLYLDPGGDYTGINAS